MDEVTLTKRTCLLHESEETYRMMCGRFSCGAQWRQGHWHGCTGGRKEGMEEGMKEGMKDGGTLHPELTHTAEDRGKGRAE
jgi:hypothetical protein